LHHQYCPEYEVHLQMTGSVLLIKVSNAITSPLFLFYYHLDYTALAFKQSEESTTFL